MYSSAARKPVKLTETQVVTASTGKTVARKIWLPKVLYDALPYFYLGSGILAFLATLYVSAWFWVLPHYLLFSAACIHLGLVIFYRRSRRRPSDESTGD